MAYFFANRWFAFQKSFSLWVLLGGFYGVAAHAHETGQTWYLFQPMVRTALVDPLARHYAKVLPQYLNGKVVLKSTGKSPLSAREKVGLSEERANSTAVLMAPLIYEKTYDAEVADKSSSRVTALHMVARRPWCLAITHDVQPRTYEGLMKWLSGLRRPVRIGLVAPTGMPAVWLEAMRRKTGLEWVATDFFFSADQSVESLLSGQQDLLLDACGEVNRVRALPGNDSGSRKIQVLITDQKELEKGPTSFAQWQLTAPAPSWVGWFVSSSMPQERRARLGKALYAVSMREDTQALIRELGKEPMPLSEEGSQRYVDSWLRDWKSIGSWMRNLPGKLPADTGRTAPKLTTS